MLQLLSEVLLVTVNGYFTVENGTTEMATDASDYQLTFENESGTPVMMTPSDVVETRPTELYVQF